MLWSDAHVDPGPGWAEAFAAVLADPRVGAVGPAIASLSDRARVGYGLRCKNAALEEEWLPRQSDDSYPVPILSSCFMAVRRDVFDQTGGFDPGLILWGSGEIELSFRLWALGYECRIAPQAQAAHLFRSRFPYTVNSVHIVHNLLRTAIIHFGQDRLAAVITALRQKPAFPEALALVMDSDVWARRADIRSRRVINDQAFFDRFPMNGLNPAPSASMSTVA